jgi:hypothetical protein
MTTLGSVARDEAVQEAVPGNSASPESNRECAPRAKSIPTALTAASASPAEEVTERNARQRILKVVEGARSRAKAVSAGPSLLHTAPASLADKHTFHRDAAKQWDAWLVRYPRLWWGYLHLGVKAALHLADWLTESFWRLAIAIALYFIIRIWI